MKGPPFRVVGHPRSGNHALASLLHSALVPNLPGHRFPNGGIGHWSQRRAPARYEGSEGKMVDMPYYRVLGDHRFPTRARHPRAVCVVRDGRDVALSFHRWERLRRPDQRELSLSEYVMERVDWRGSPGQRARQRAGYTLFDHWRDHVTAWVSAAGVIVRYEELLLDPHAVVERVADHFGLSVRGPTDRPDAVGWNASASHAVSQWKDALPDQLVALFDRKVPPGHPGRWDH